MTEDGEPMQPEAPRFSAGSAAARFVAWLVTVFVLFIPHIAQNVTLDEYRFIAGWEIRHDLLFLFGLAFLAAVLVIAEWLLRLYSRQWATPICGHVLVIAFCAGIFANIAYWTDRPVGYRVAKTGTELGTLWLLLVSMVGYSIAKGHCRLIKWTQRTCFVLSPVIPIASYFVLTAHHYHIPFEPLPPAVQSKAVLAGYHGQRSTPVYFFIFDAWSYERTYGDRTLSPVFKNLGRIAAQSTVFHNAETPAPYSAASFPRFLFHSEAPMVRQNGKFWFQEGDQLVPIRQRKSIFALVEGKGYTTAVVGTGLPYRTWMGDQVDTYRVFSWDWARGPWGLLNGLCTSSIEAMRSWTDPWSPLIHRKAKLWSRTRIQRNNHPRHIHDILRVIKEQPANTFALFHVMVPHRPFILEYDAESLRPGRMSWDRESIEGYQSSLVYLDRLVGDFIGAIREKGRFEDALIIITSDHAWRNDPDIKNKVHVPLIVKLPYQQEGIVIDQSFKTQHIGSLIKYALETEHPAHGIREMISKVDGRPPF